MNNRSQFKLIAFLVIISLIALESFQGYWLKNLYNTLFIQTENTVRNALRMADYKELFLRMEDVKREQVKENPGQDHSFVFHYVHGTTPSDSTASALQIQMSAEDEEDFLGDVLPEYLAMVGKIENIALSFIHETIDSIRPIDQQQFAGFLEIEFQENNIPSVYMLELYDQESAGWQLLSVTTPDGQRIKPGRKNMVIEHEHTTYGGQKITYRLTLKNPGKLIFWKMSGIMLSSFLLTLLVVGSFIYLLRTILHQKTEKELKNDFINNVTHELKTPIAVAVAANDALLNYDETINEKQKKYLTIVNEQLKWLTGMVEQILSLSVENRSTFRLHKQPIRVARLLPSIIEQQKIKTKKQLDIRSEIDEDLSINADRTHLNNILSNLVENAVKYSDKDPVVIRIQAQQTGTGTILSVTDNGIGISEENQKRIFDKFFRVPQGNLHNVKGYGLGLFYIKDIMTKHGGTVTVTSQPHKGSTFSLIFKNNK
ncbi:MAG: HAMP domain-containing histidine kinase [Tannerellaceae bacterium]|nr:HAMP domain-containing histidine kinase [Tannerellaceae bacterium]